MKQIASRTFLLITALLLTISSISVQPVFGMDDNQKDIFNQAINYYNVNDCDASSGGGSTDSSGGNSGENGKYSKDDVAKFASSPITATWNISDSKVEQWFLGTGTAVISRYGITSSNISQITSAVKNTGVSPVFFYMYTVNEGGGAGGYINHYASSSGNMIADAKKDAQYIVSQSKNMTSPPATLGGEPADMPTAEAEKFLKDLPAGSIGRMYIPATSAATAEIEDLYGKHGGWTGKFGKPLQDAMDRIKTIGGDPLVAGANITTGDSDECASSNGSADQNLILKWAEYFQQWGTSTNNGVYYSQQNCAHAYSNDANQLKGCINAGQNPPFHGQIDCSGFQIAVVFMATGTAPGNMVAGPGGYAAGNGQLIADSSKFKQVDFKDAKPGDFWVAIGTMNHIETVQSASGGSVKTIDETGVGVHDHNQSSGNIWRYTGPWDNPQSPPSK